MSISHPSARSFQQQCSVQFSLFCLKKEEVFEILAESPGKRSGRSIRILEEENKKKKGRRKEAGHPALSGRDSSRLDLPLSVRRQGSWKKDSAARLKGREREDELAVCSTKKEGSLSCSSLLEGGKEGREGASESTTAVVKKGRKGGAREIGVEKK